jgi:hypothetical protein
MPLPRRAELPCTLLDSSYPEQTTEASPPSTLAADRSCWLDVAARPARSCRSAAVVISARRSCSRVILGLHQPTTRRGGIAATVDRTG